MDKKQKHDIILEILPEMYYNPDIVESIKRIDGKKVCYVTLNKTSKALKNTFTSNGINTDNIFFVDAISKSIGLNDDKNDTLFISSPYAFTEISIALSQLMKHNVFDIVFFDSLSALKVYEKNNQISERFTKDLIRKVRKNQENGIFTCLEEDKNTELIKETFMNVDKIVNLKNFNDNLEKRYQTRAFSLITLFFLFLSFSFINLNPTNKGINYGLAIGSLNMNLNYTWIVGLLGGIIVILSLVLLNQRYKIKTIDPKKIKKTEPKSENVLKREIKEKIIYYKKKISA
jgi:hypothetical protein|tara:strand:+ start:626 stop:1489 length:864 start_codon:yes stop_codon:yes gene_type:complete